MTIRSRLLILIGALGVFSTAIFFGLELLQQREYEAIRVRRERELAARLQSTLAENSGALRRYVRNYAARPALAEFVATRDARWAERNLQDRLDTYRVDAVWVLDASGATIHGFKRLTGELTSEPPLPQAELQPLLAGSSGTLDFFCVIGGALHQMFGQRISANPERAPTGAWLVAARVWNAPLLEEIATAAQGQIRLTTSAHTPDAVAHGEMETWQPLKDHRGRVVAGLDFHVLDPQASDVDEENTELTLFALNAVGTVLIAGLLLHFWIWRPLATLQHSIIQSDTTPLLRLIHRRDEFGRLSRIVHSSLRDREALAQALEAQARVGRDLHDSIIQRLFGVGMSLTKIETLAGTDPEASKQLAVQTRADLNHVVAELRGYIERTDPRPSEGAFADAARAIGQQLRGSAATEISVDIDEALASRYPALIRGQVLQFAREAMSNAVRHGEPSRVELSWCAAERGSVLRLSDDGGGFEIAGIDTRGRGLGNLTERAIVLGGRLKIDSRPGTGTEITLHLPPPERSP